MDTLDPRRRRATGVAAGDAELAEGDFFPNYDQAALGHGRRTPERGQRALGPDGAMELQPAVSPAAMELGMVASPFHSEIVQAEVALRLSRPQSLDDDARALGKNARQVRLWSRTWGWGSSRFRDGTGSGRCPGFGSKA